MIQTEPDYGGPRFSSSEEFLDGWRLTYDKTFDSWKYEAYRESGVNAISITGEAFSSYEDAKAHCMAFIEGFTPEEYLPVKYASASDDSHTLVRLPDGRWRCERDLVPGEHTYATARLASIGFDLETFPETHEA